MQRSFAALMRFGCRAYAVANGMEVESERTDNSARELLATLGWTGTEVGSR